MTAGPEREHLLQFTAYEYENALKRAEKHNLPELEGPQKDVEKAIVVRDRLFLGLMHEMSGFYAFAIVMDIRKAREYIEDDYDTLRRVLLWRIGKRLSPKADRARLLIPA